MVRRRWKNIAGRRHGVGGGGGRTCCDRSVFSVLESGFEFDSLVYAYRVDRMYAQFPTCVKFDLRRNLWNVTVAQAAECLLGICELRIEKYSQGSSLGMGCGLDGLSWVDPRNR